MKPPARFFLLMMAAGLIHLLLSLFVIAQGLSDTSYLTREERNSLDLQLQVLQPVFYLFEKHPTMTKNILDEWFPGPLGYIPILGTSVLWGAVISAVIFLIAALKHAAIAKIQGEHESFVA